MLVVLWQLVARGIPTESCASQQLHHAHNQYPSLFVHRVPRFRSREFQWRTVGVSMHVPRAILEQLKQLVPLWMAAYAKARQSGCVGVLGGALDYSGVPHFAAISALKLGADLLYVICSPTASLIPPI
jgi:hypothetical protein